MKKTLEELTMSQFIDLVCGDHTVLTGGFNAVSKEELTKVIRNIVYEYRSIADDTGTRLYMSKIEAMSKERMSLALFSVCDNLINMNEHDRVREVLKEYGINAETMTDKRVAAEVKSRLVRARNALSGIMEENRDETIQDSDIRREFDAQTVSLMAHFKFQIDTGSMKASVYAHLVARHNRELKARIAAMNKK